MLNLVLVSALIWAMQKSLFKIDQHYGPNVKSCYIANIIKYQVCSFVNHKKYLHIQ